jgi:hypothetical protein
LIDHADASIPPVDGFKRTAAGTRGQAEVRGFATGFATDALCLSKFALTCYSMVAQRRVMVPPLRKHESHARWDSAAPRVLFGITGRRPHGAAWTKILTDSSPCPFPSYAAGTPYRHVASRGWGTDARAWPGQAADRQTRFRYHAATTDARRAQGAIRRRLGTCSFGGNRSPRRWLLELLSIMSRLFKTLPCQPCLAWHLASRNRPLKRRAKHLFQDGLFSETL